MKAPSDKFTVDIFGDKVRGRPPTGRAKSAAERQAASRARKAAKGSPVTVRLDTALLACLEALATSAGVSVEDFIVSHLHTVVAPCKTLS